MNRGILRGLKFLALAGMIAGPLAYRASAGSAVAAWPRLNRPDSGGFTAGAQRLPSAEHKDRDRYKHAEGRLSTFDRHLVKHHFDKGELDERHWRRSEASSTTIL